MAKRVSKKEKLFNLELYVQTLEERIQRLEEENSKHSTYISHNVTDIRNVEVAMDGLKLELGEQGGVLALLRDNVQEHVINIDNLNTAVNGILTSAKDSDVKNSIIDVIHKTDDIELLKAVVEAGADPNYQNGAPMRIAMLANKPNMIKALIALGARHEFKPRPTANCLQLDTIFVLDTRINK